MSNINKQITKKDVASFFGITSATLCNYEKKAIEGDIKSRRKLDALYDYYIRHNKIDGSPIKRLKSADGQNYILIME